MSKIKRIPLGGGFHLWTLAQVRGAGFSTRWLDGLDDERAWERLRQVASEPLFREAVAWQNLAAITTGLDSWLSKDASENNARTRKKALLVARYLQRYVTKCDTIGFFGPIGWARLGSKRSGVSVKPGKALFRTARARFEPWSMRALAGTLPLDAVPPRVHPRIRLGDVRLKLNAQTWELLRACDGKRTLASLSKRFSFDVREQLLALQARGLVQWRVDVPASAQPEKNIPGARGLKAARKRAQQAVGNELAVRHALADVAAQFESATQQAATRNAGETYAGRQVLYLDTRRDCRVQLGQDVVDAIAQPLVMLCQSARWFCAELSSRFVASLTKKFLPAVRHQSRPLSHFWDVACERLEDADAPEAIAAEAVLVARWQAIFEETELPVSLLVDTAFPWRSPGWPGARHFAPDIMIAQRPHEQPLFVLGELHVGMHPWRTISALEQALNPSEIMRAVEEETGPSIAPITDAPFARSCHELHRAKRARHIDTGSDYASTLPGSRVDRLGDFDLCARRGKLVVRHLPSKREYSLAQIFERHLKMQAVSRFRLLPAAPHRERKMLGALVVARETWTLDETDVEALVAACETHEGAKAYAAAKGFPRRIFVRSPDEVKPVFVDWQSAMFVEMLRRLARQTDALTISEMLPDIHETWLNDAAGERYVSELRMIVVDRG